jgi:hypothetical protein
VRELIVCIALAIVGLTYILYSIKDGSWFNALTPQLIIAIPTLYIAQLGRLYFGFDTPGTVASWLYVFSCYCIPLTVFAWTLCYGSVPHFLRIRSRRRLEIRRSPWVLLAISVLLYLPILIEFRANLLSPRVIYEQTRSGYGLNFFLSTMFAMLGFMLYLFKSRTPKRRFVYFAICAVLSLAHGSKGSVLTLGMIWLLHRRYAEGRRLSFGQAGFIVACTSVMMLGLFYLLSTGVELSELGNFILGYSDYTANGLMVVSDDKAALYGQIFLEDNVFSRIPRALFADKPKDFGSFYLANMYFPESFELDQGVPAFGIGATFADFKWLTLPILCVLNHVLGLVAKTCRNSLRRFGQPGDFIVFMFLCGVPLLSVGVGFMLPRLEPRRVGEGGIWISHGARGVAS